MQQLVLSVASYITPTTIKAALFLVTFIFVCAGLGRRSVCGLIPLAITAFISVGLFVVRLSAPGYMFALMDVVLLVGYAVVGIASLLALRVRGFGVVAGVSLLAVESYQAITQGAVLIAAAMKGFHEAGGALSEQEIDLWSLAWCLFSMIFMVIYCFVIGLSRTFLKKDRALIESELLLQASPLPIEMTLEEIMPVDEEELPEEEIIPDEPLPSRYADIPEEEEEAEIAGNSIGAEILRYKHLLDEGLITEEVFRERKEELMNGLTRGTF